jgi:hypothetical protein
VVQELARSEGVEITDARLNERWLELDEETREQGIEGGLGEYLKQNTVDPVEFRRLLRLSMVQESLARSALGIPPDGPITSEQQIAWLREVVAERGLETVAPPWEEGVVARCGELIVTPSELASELRLRLPDESLQDSCFELLLERRIRERMPDLSTEALGRAVEAEIQRRKAEAEANPEYQGLSYPQLLAARGLTLDVVRRDPAVRSAALSRLWVERGFDDAELRAVYESERPEFDGRFGEGVAVAMIQLVAGDRTNTLVPRTYEEAERELTGLRTRIGGTEDFLRLARETSEDLGGRLGPGNKGGEVGIVTRLAGNLPASLRVAIFELLDSRQGDVSGPIK